MKARRKLRVAVFADSSLQPRWVVEGFANVALAGFAELVVVAAGRSAQGTTPWLCKVCGSLDKRLFKSQFGSAPDPSQRIELATAAPAARFCSLPQPDAGAAAVAAWRAEMRSLDLDVAFGLGNLNHLALENLAKHGLWYYRFGEERDLHEPTAGLREVIEGAPITRSGLVARLPSGAEERMVYESCSRTFPYSVARNRDNLLRKTAQFSGRALRALHRSGEAWLAERAHVSRADPGTGERPGAFACAQGLSSVGRRIARRSVEKLLYVDQWVLAYRFGDVPHGAEELRSFMRLMPPKDRFWADPFPLARAQRHFIFFEDYAFSAGKGRIAVVEVAADGMRCAPVPVLERGYHLSYPYLIEDDGELFMVPETGANRTVELYRCVEFPHRWQLEKVLLRDARYLDATIHRVGERWWMFVSVAVPGTDGYDELNLYHADRLIGPWQPHEANPVKSDVRCARPAGRLYQRNGALYRPAQVCAPLYGSGLSINRVLHLSPDSYVEREEHRIVPTPAEGALGLHTLNRAGDLTVIDLFVQRPRFGRRRAIEAGPAQSSTWPLQKKTQPLWYR